MREESKSVLDDFVEDNQFELDSYLTYLFDQINNDIEVLSET
ncbi:hypothetical protein P4678_25920 [Priestia megaterium]|nr:hypothetical protein [Priestia megaterium]MED4298049.1 hypothetical protein [Priestia megaterium]